jgi:Tfp pilus assembly protein FimT
MVEMAIVLTIGGILIGYALPRLQGTLARREVAGARDGVMLLAARARARAMEQAQTVEFHLDADAGLAAVLQAGDTVEALRFNEESGVLVRSAAGNVVMCYTARGYATEPCSTDLTGPAEVVFYRGSNSASLEVWQLGQLRKL